MFVFGDHATQCPPIYMKKGRKSYPKCSTCFPEGSGGGSGGPGVVLSGFASLAPLAFGYPYKSLIPLAENKIPPPPGGTGA